jgi:hypothetical protein
LVYPDSVRTEYARDELNLLEPLTLGDALRRPVATLLGDSLPIPRTLRILSTPRKPSNPAAFS